MLQSKAMPSIATFLNKRKASIIRITLGVILTVGIFLRLWQYVRHDSFWKDETGIAVNFLSRDLAHIQEPFQNGQAAPVGFVQASKIAEMALGHNEHAFWLFPFILGIASLFAAVVFWKRQLPKGAWLLAVALLAFNTTLIMHVTQFKPYLGDSFWALLLTGAFFAQQQGKHPGNLIWILCGISALWMSYTSVLVIAGLGLWQIGEAVYKRDRKKIVSSLIANGILGAVFIFLWATNYSHIDREFFGKFWAPNFAPFIFQPGWVGWYSHDFGAIIGYLFGQTQWLVIIFFAALGLAHAWGVNRKLWALTLPVALTFIASWCGIYPLYDRLEMFWIPLLTPFLALGVYSAWELFSKQHHGMTALFIIFVLLPFLHPLWAVGHSEDFQQLKQAALLVRNKAQPGDIVYVHNRAASLYQYYFLRYPLKKGVTLVPGSKEELKDPRAMLEKRYSGKRVFFLYTEPWYSMNEIELLEMTALNTGELKSTAKLNLAGAMELEMK
jgi:hypothetical protein